MLGSGFVAEFYMQGLANVNGQKSSSTTRERRSAPGAFAKRWGIAESTTDLKRVIARDDIDLFLIALPNQEHLPVLALSEAKRNQVCTKPLARNRNEAKQMFVAARKSGAHARLRRDRSVCPCGCESARDGRSRRIWERCYGYARANRIADHTAHTSGMSSRQVAGL